MALALVTSFRILQMLVYFKKSQSHLDAACLLLCINVWPHWGHVVMAWNYFKLWTALTMDYSFHLHWSSFSCNVSSVKWTWSQSIKAFSRTVAQGLCNYSCEPVFPTPEAKVQALSSTHWSLIERTKSANVCRKLLWWFDLMRRKKTFEVTFYGETEMLFKKKIIFKTPCQLWLCSLFFSFMQHLTQDGWRFDHIPSIGALALWSSPPSVPRQKQDWWAKQETKFYCYSGRWYWLGWPGCQPTRNKA